MMGERLHRRAELGGDGLCGVRHRRLRPPSHGLELGLAGEPDRQCPVPARRARTGGSHGSRPTEPGLVHHSDRGVQYVSIKYTERLVEAGINPSVGSVGDSYDNALAETVIGLFKTEVILRQGPWRGLAAAEIATMTLGLLLKAAASLSGLLRCCSQGVDWYNTRRLLGSIGNIPPAEAEANHHAALEATPMAA